MIAGTHTWTAQQRVRHGTPVIQVLPPELAQAKRVVLVTTRSLGNSRLIVEAKGAIGGKLAGTFGAMRAHSPVEDVVALAALLAETRADLVVAVGGGSVIDGSKVACVATWRGLAGAEAIKGLAVPRASGAKGWDGAAPTPRIVAVPTTLSAAEFAPYAGFTDLAEGRKMRCQDEWAVPVAVILDPAATLETPAELLLSSGIRALDHAAERWCSTTPQPFSDAVSRQAMIMLADGLPAAKRDPSDLGARALCQQAMWMSVMGGWSGVPVGASHGIGYILGGAKGVPHGITSCLTLHAVMRWNAPVNAGRQKDIAAILGGPDGATAIHDFVAGLGLPTRLSQVGIDASEIPALAARWNGDAPIATNPRPVKGAADLEEILRLFA